ncbi:MULTISPECIES: leucine-rich repeat domain-containing protein [Clostridium]|uniref:Leucine-rich repeat domain-containing protein n=1 Tax=Clostridium frigoriphilum TaxID=443253 RepID=A0ABU7UVC9_9CLOT|nr:leucine-rich repeat domain-containing protein [Clostridium sp. DSM 17811]MBU3101773.1 leucine-rich repeat domain-containing protein [Clostridium sp. DSM 17811]
MVNKKLYKRLSKFVIALMIVSPSLSGVAHAAIGDIINTTSKNIYDITSSKDVQALIADLKDGGGDQFLKESTDGKYYSPNDKLTVQTAEIVKLLKAANVSLTDSTAIKTYIKNNAAEIVADVKVETDKVATQTVDTSNYTKVTPVVSNVSVNSISDISPITTIVGTTPILPTTVPVTLSDGTTDVANETWTNIPDVTVAGTVTVDGILSVPTGKTWTLTDAQKSVSVKVTVNPVVSTKVNIFSTNIRPNSFGAIANLKLTTDGVKNFATATKYQLFDGVTKISAQAVLGSDTIVFPAKVTGDIVTVKLLDVDGTVLKTEEVVLGQYGTLTITPVSVQSVSATDGKVNVILNGAPTVEPEAEDFVITQKIGDGAATTVVPEGFYVDSKNNLLFTIPTVATTSSDQSVVYGVSYKNEASFKTVAFTIKGGTGINTIVTFPDKVFDQLIREAIYKPTGNLYKWDVEKITDIGYVGGNIGQPIISDISGIEYLTNLKVLFLHNTNINDISQLKGLTNLTQIDLGFTIMKSGEGTGTNITDISALKGLTNLTQLNLPYNNITDISALKGLSNLTDIDLSHNKIENLEPLRNLTNLKGLSLVDNQITNIEPLSELTNLTGISLADNQINNIEPLTKLTNLTLLNLNSNQIINIEPLAGLVNLTSLRLSTNQINDYSPVKSFYNSLTEVDFNLTDTFDATVITFPDKNLEKSIRNIIRRPNGNIFKGDVNTIWELDASDSNITDISGVEYFTKLNSLDLSNNQISNVEPLRGLTNLESVDLSNNQISNVEPLRGLTNLESVNLSNNQINNLEPLRGMTNLIYLNLAGNQLNNIEPLKGMTELVELYLDGNQITDYTSISSFYNNILYKDFTI